MSYEPRLITPFKTGLVKYYKPWLIAEDAFPSLFNAYAWRGSVRKREGYEKFGKLPNADSPVQGLKNWVDQATLVKTLVAFSLTKSYVWDTGPMTPVFRDITFLQNPGGTAFSWSNGTADYFYTSNYAGSMWVTNNLVADGIYYWTGIYGALGVNGGWNIFIPTVNGSTQLTAALIILPYKGRLVVLNTTEDVTNFPSRARWSQIGTPYTSNSSPIAITSVTASGANTIIGVSNTTTFTIGLPAGIVGIVGSVGAVLNFNQFTVTGINPGVSVTIAVNTSGLTRTSGGFIQGPGTTIAQNGYEISIFAWRDDIVGRGGYIDADTSERIISADIIKDTLIVFFQRSTWRLRYTGNEILPFIWERLNTQYGAEATFSNIAFDDAILAFSRFGWIASDTNNVTRIDENIPDDCFTVNGENSTLGLTRIQGLRDFFRQTAYWTFPTLNPGVEPNQIYVFNYLDKNWSIIQPTNAIRCFGEYSQSVDVAWQNLAQADDTWANYGGADDMWSEFGIPQAASFPLILGGDDTGTVYQMFDYGVAPSTTDNGTTFNFSIATKRLNPYIDKGQKCRVGYVDLYITTITRGEITFQHFINDQQNPVFSQKMELYPRGTTEIAAILRGSPTTFRTVDNHQLINGQLVLITDMTGPLGQLINNNNFTATVLDSTRFTIDFDSTGIDFSYRGMVNNPMLTNYGESTYKRVFLGAIAHMHQFVITLTSEQLEDPSKGSAQIELQGMVIWSRPAGMIRG